MVPVPANTTQPTPKPETDAFHNPIMVPKTDVYGQPVTDKNGNPVLVPKPDTNAIPTTTTQQVSGSPEPGRIVCNQGWTYPMNVDSPSTGNGDNETLANLRSKFSFCSDDDILAARCSEVKK
jgi:hypothetical protein